MNHLLWNTECISLKVKGKLFGYIALTGTLQFPAIGGIRIIQNEFDPNGLDLVLCLSETMYKKARAANLPLSGGKAILYIPKLEQKSYYLKQFSNILNQLKGRYITAVDLGCSQYDMDSLSKYSTYLTCNTASGGDPSRYTAQTVIQSIKAAYAHCFNESLHDTNHIVIQGLGKVGMHLLKQLRLLSPKIIITVADIMPINFPKLEALNINHVGHEEIYAQPCDIFISAADSKIIGTNEVRQLNCKIFAAAANNPFTNNDAEKLLTSKGTTILPDYLINVGGLIYCAYQYGLIQDLTEKINEVYQTVIQYLVKKAI